MKSTSVTTFDSNKLKYARGFALGFAPPSDCVYAKVPFIIPFYVHINTKYAMIECDDRCIIIIGTAIHPDYPDYRLEDVCRLLAYEKENMQTNIDLLVGRFFIIIRDGNKIFVQKDAIGLRSAFYAFSKCGILVASHAKMLAEHLSSNVRYNESCLGYPGLNAKFEGIRRVPVNCTLSLSDGKIRRFFPLKPFTPKSIAEAWETAIRYSGAAFSGLCKQNNILISLTAGFDSRSTLAISRPFWDKCQFFTYKKGQVYHKEDLAVAKEISNRCLLSHDCFDLDDYKAQDKLLKIISMNTIGKHGYSLAAFYHNYFSPEKYLHVRTNLTELFRGHLPKNNSNSSEIVDILCHFFCNSWKKKLIMNEKIYDDFAEFETSCELKKIPSCYNLEDIYFIEHRMAAWQADLVCESDVAFDTVIIFNSREMIKQFLEVSIEDRHSDYLLNMLKNMLPELVDIPVNPKVWPPITL